MGCKKVGFERCKRGFYACWKGVFPTTMSCEQMIKMLTTFRGNATSFGQVGRPALPVPMDTQWVRTGFLSSSVPQFPARGHAHSNELYNIVLYILLIYIDIPIEGKITEETRPRRELRNWGTEELRNWGNLFLLIASPLALGGQVFRPAQRSSIPLARCQNFRQVGRPALPVSSVRGSWCFVYIQRQSAHATCIVPQFLSSSVPCAALFPQLFYLPSDFLYIYY